MQLLAVEAERVTPGLLGFFVFVALALATWALLRSLNSRLKNVRFEERDELDGPEDAGGRTRRSR